MALKKKRTAEEYFRRKISSPLANFLGIVAGFTALLMIVLIIYNGLLGEASPQAVSENSDILTSENKDLIKNVALHDSLTPAEFSKAVATATGEELSEFLERMNAQTDAIAQVPIRIERNRQRVKAADQLLLMYDSPEQYELASKSKLLALSAIYNTALESDFVLEVTEESDQLLKFATSLTSDSSTPLRLHARLTVVGIELVEASKRATAISHLEDSVELVGNLLKDYKDSEIAFNYIQMILPRIMTINSDFGLGLAEGLLDNAQEFESDHAKQFFRDMYDYTLLTKTGVTSKIESLWIGDESNRQELFAIAINIASDPQTGEKILDSLAMLSHWIEQEQEFETAKRVYQLLIDTSSARSTPSLVEMAARAGQNGLRRCEAFGRRLNFHGPQYKGGPLDSGQFKDCFVVVLFVSHERMNLHALLNDLYGELTQLANRRVKFVMVSLDKNPNKIFESLVSEYPLICFVNRGDDEEQPPSIYQQYPAHVIPQAILVNPEGKIIRTALKPMELNEILNSEILKFQTN